MSEYILQISGLFKYFGKANVIYDVTALVEIGKIMAIIGPNGAGKTTLFNLITNLVPKEKQVKVKIKRITKTLQLVEEQKIIKPQVLYKFNGKFINITWEKPHKIARLGIGRTFQGNRVFSNMTVLENVMLAKDLTEIENPLSIINISHKKLLKRFNMSSAIKGGEKRDLEKFLKEEAEYWLDFVGLGDKKKSKGEELSYGQQKLLSIARLLMADCRLLLFDEPTAGVNPKYSEKIAGIFQKIVEKGDKTILFIEHDMKFIQKLGCKCLYMENGRCPWEFYELGVIMKNEDIRRKFLGI